MAKNKIIINHVEHHDRKRMEFFLNALEDELKETPIEWKEMKMSDRIISTNRFISTTSSVPLTITVYFCDSYFEALEIAKANALPNTDKARWGINGSLMYLVETEDHEKLNDVLSLFAGRE